MRARGRLAALAAVVLVATVGCGGEPDRPGDLASWQLSPPPSAAAAEPEESRAIPSPTAPPASEPTSRPTRSQPAEPEPEPPPIPPRYEGECIAEYDGDAVSRSDVAAALSAAAGRTYWPTSAPSIRVPENLLRATAWQESGWQSNVIACDGGVGLMQVMPGTAEWMNTRFGQSYDINAYTDNAYLGGTYYAWLIKFFGDLYFGGDYSVDPADCASHVDPCLLNAIIASYNFGHGAVDSDDGIVIPNPRYVENVRALMTGCECLSF